MRVTRRQLQVAIGVLWLADGLLQLQPFMFTTGFGHQILAPAGDGQPPWVAGPVHYFAIHFAQHPLLLNSVAATVQLALGAAFFVRRALRLAIIASVVWSVAVWWLGEGLGGLAGGHTSLLVGAPGAAILYGLLATASWPPRPSHQLDDGTRPARWLPPAWTTIWLVGAVLQMLPAQRNPDSLAKQIRASAEGAPGWIAATDRTAADVIAHAGPGGIVLTVIAMAAVGLGALIPGRVRTIAAYTGAGLAALFWLVGQNLGELYTGQATDPNSALLLIVFAAAIGSVMPVLGHQTDDQPATWPQPRPEPMHATQVTGSRRPLTVRI